MGVDSKWIVFGQSFGGMIVKKYIEYAPTSISQVITHGSGRFDAVATAVNTEIITAQRIAGYFKKFPDDLEKVEEIRSTLSKSDVLESDFFRIRGTALLDFLSILYTVKSADDLHLFFQKLNSDDREKSFIAAIRPLAELVLTAGLLNQAIAQINLIGEMNTQQVAIKAREMLRERNMNVDESIISKMRFEERLETVSDYLMALEELFAKRIFHVDVLDYEKIVRTSEDNEIAIDIFGGESDALAFEAIRSEEELIRQYGSTRFKFHYSKGHHREWLSNEKLFKDVLANQL